MRLARLPGGRRIWCTPRGAAELRVVYQEIFEERAYERGGLRVADGDVVVDVGSNVGLFALYFLEQRQNLKVICIEPTPPIRACLERNLAAWSGRKGHEITILPCAASDVEGDAMIEFLPGIPANSTLDPTGKRVEIEGVIERFRLRDVWNMNRSRGNGTAIAMVLLTLLTYPFRRAFFRFIVRRGMKGSEVFRCKLRRLEVVFEECALRRVDLLKIDVEGAEFDALEGLGESGLALVRQIAVEVAPYQKARLPTLMGRLREVGFNRQSLESPAGGPDVFEDPYPCMLFATRDDVPMIAAASFGRH